MEKVPALQDGDACVAESGAIVAYLAEKFPQAGLAPAIGEADARALPAMAVLFRLLRRGRDHPEIRQCRVAGRLGGVGLVRQGVQRAGGVLSAGPYLLGETFSAADVLIASDLHFVIDVFKMLEPRPVFTAYLERCRSRPAFLRAQKIDSDGV